MDGTIRLATTRANNGPAPRNRCWNARPPDTAMATVAAMTITPSNSDRTSAEPMSPTACSWNRRLNQCSDTPRIGKVSPPSGPSHQAQYAGLAAAARPQQATEAAAGDA